MDWPTAAVLIAIVIAVMAVLSTYIAARYSRSRPRQLGVVGHTKGLRNV
jgi:hypothetical protein